MKRYLLLAFLLFLCSVAQLHAQREPQFTNYMDNKLIYNPAFAGSTENISATILYHNQWSDFHSSIDNSKAPITETFTLHGPLDMFPKVELGAGVHFLNDNLGFEHTFSAGLDLSYKKRLPNVGTNGSILSGGLSIGYVQSDLAGDWKPQDPTDTRLPGSVSDKSPDFGLGAYLTNQNFYAGASALHVTSPSLTWEGGGQSKIPRAYYFIAGYNYYMDQYKLEIMPGTLIRTDFAKTQYDIHTIAMYNHFVFVGLNYHAQDALSIIGGIYILKNTKLQGSYDITTSDASAFGGKIEVLLNYSFNLNLAPAAPLYHKSSLWL